MKNINGKKIMQTERLMDRHIFLKHFLSYAIHSTSYFCSILCVAFALFACRQKTSASMVKHDFGETSRPATNLAPCKESSEPQLKPAVAYLRKIATYIADADPKTFSGPYALEHFCFAVTNDETINAYAKANTREITFNIGTIRKAEHDAEIAGIMAHELAHVTMQNAITVHPALPKNAEWNRLNKEFADMRTKTRSIYSAVYKARQANIDARKDLLDHRIASLPETLKIERNNFKENYCTVITLLSSLRENQKTSTQANTNSNSNSPIDDFWSRAFKARQKIAAIYPLDKNEDPPITGSLCEQGESAANPQSTPKTSMTEMSTEITALEVTAENLRNKIETAYGEKFMLSLATLDSIAADIRQKTADLRAPEEALQDKIAALVTQILGKGTAANWTEQEADEVGFEFYLRAGLSPAYFNWIEEVGSNAITKDCRKQLTEIRAGGANIPDRGSNTHPSACWRMYDIMIYEAKKHANDYAPLLAKACKIDLFPGELLGLKDLQIPNESTKTR